MKSKLGNEKRAHLMLIDNQKFFNENYIEFSGKDKQNLVCALVIAACRFRAAWFKKGGLADLKSLAGKFEADGYLNRAWFDNLVLGNS